MQLVYGGNGNWYTQDDWIRHQAELARNRMRDRLYRQRPEVQQRRRAYMLVYREEHRDELRAYNREWMRWYRSEQRRG